MTELTVDVPIKPIAAPNRAAIPSDAISAKANTSEVTHHPLRTGMIAGAAVTALSEVGRTFEMHHALEQPDDPRNVFEPGIHFKDPKDRQQASEAFDNGDPYVNYWVHNPELRNRLISYSPSVLTIDGLSVPLHYGNYNKKEIWLRLPARPALLDPSKKETFVIAGDNEYVDFTEDYPLSERLNAAELQEDSNADDSAIAADRATYGTLGLTALIGIAGGVDRYLARRGGKKRGGNYPSQKAGPTRRTLLKGAGAVLGALTLNKVGKVIGAAVSDQAVETPDERKKAILQTVNAYLNEFPKDIWTDGRTALLIAKHQDGMDLLRGNNSISEEAKGSIVMGSSHIGKAEVFLHDKKQRDQAILAYAKHLVALTGKIIDDHYHFSSVQKADFTKSMLDNFVELNVLRVRDSEIQPTEGLLEDYVNKNIDVVYPNVVSGQVAETIKSIHQVSDPSFQASK